MSEISIGKCPSHDRAYEGFCKLCTVVVCPSCVMFGAHKKHDILTLKQGAMFIRREIDTAMFKGLLKKETSETKILSIRENGLIIEKSKTETVQKLEAIFKGIVHCLKARRDFLINEINQKFNDQRQKIDFNINLRKEIIKEIQLIPKFVEENINLNPSQEKAIRNALMYHLSLVIGPPGSGKTLLLVNLVYNILFHKGSTEKILICAPTNKAIDNIIILLKKYNFSKYVRVLSPGRELSKGINTTVAVHKLALEKINNNPKIYRST